jgi:hypothetical protein
MARVQGPLHSDAASGTFAGSLVYSHWKGARAYVRERVIPKNPKTAKQIGVRAMWGFLAAAWKTIGTVPQATWEALGITKAISAFDAFMSANMTGWQSFLAPQQNYAEDRDSTGLTVTTQTCTGGVGSATVQITPSGSTDSWGVIIFRGLTGFTPSWENAIAVIPTDGTNPVTWVDSPLEAGTYYYRAVVVNTDGKMGTIHAESTGVVVS